MVKAAKPYYDAAVVPEPVTAFRDKKSPSAAGTVDRALALFTAPAEDPDQQLITLAGRGGLNKATAFRHLKVLEGPRLPPSRPLPLHGGNTITDPEVSLDHLARVWTAGYAIDAASRRMEFGA